MPKTKPVTGKKTTVRSGRAKDLLAVKGNPFSIVAIGASSGGLEAVTELLKYLPPDTGMAYIFIQHLSPDHKSILVSLLAKSTKMVVQEIEDMERIVPDNVYVIPYNKGIEVTDGHIKLVPRSKNGPAMSIDLLFSSLAETHKEGAIGVVLSGNASDGTMGLKAIKHEGGITFAQDNSAKYNSMPESAISEGVADFILPPKEIALELDRISKHASKRIKDAKAGREITIDDNDPDLKTILRILHEGVGVDFSHYKMNTIKRRILRRMFFYKISTFKEYMKLLKTNNSEIEVLYNDLLINFTDFFRDAEAFRYFKTTLFPKLLRDKAQNETLRIWVVACATGEEAYSIAMLLIEILGKRFPGKHVQIFATDLSEHAIKKARSGLYTKSEVQAVSPKRLERFFTKVGENYRVAKPVRDMCSFAPHNILSNPPFSRIDLISCCNLLIYLDTDMHKKVLSTFHYALNDRGCLMLGKSETVGSSQLFTQINRQHKIYSRKEAARRLPDLLPRVLRPAIAEKEAPAYKKTIVIDPVTTDAAINTIIFSRFLPAYVVINQAMVIMQFKGATSRYLEHSTGKATLNILNMARPEIAFELLDAINKAFESKQEVHKSDIEIKDRTILHNIALDVIPLQTEEPLYLVVFTEQEHVEYEYNSEAGTTANGTGPAEKNNSIKKLREELAVVRAELVSVSEEKEKENKIFQAAKEEILSGNEEFQCMNEELETSKEEIESANEELITANQELQTRNELLAEAYDYSEAIVSTLHEPMLVLDKDLWVKSANKAFYKKFNVLQQDTEGRLLYELGNHQWNIPSLRDLLESIIPKETYFYDYEITHAFPNVGKRTVLLNARRILQKVHHEQLILLAFTDITEQSQNRKEEKKKLEGIIAERTAELAQSNKELEARNRALEKSNKELETFTYISSHDLQEPLRKIKNYVACLLEEEQSNLSGSGKDYLQRMRETAKRMQMLIEDLLSYARVNSEAQQFEKTNMTVIAQEVIADFKEMLKESKTTIKVTGLCHANIVPFQFRQLFSNLISNALKFSDPERPSQIIIKSEITPGNDLNIKGIVPGINYCHLSVTDNGIGFAPQYSNRIFEVFQRLHEYDEYKGTGIGLAICKRIVENHYGIITATGELNKGARFDIYIPAEI